MGGWGVEEHSRGFGDFGVFGPFTIGAPLSLCDPQSKSKVCLPYPSGILTGISLPIPALTTGVVLISSVSKG